MKNLTQFELLAGLAFLLLICSGPILPAQDPLESDTVFARNARTPEDFTLLLQPKQSSTADPGLAERRIDLVQIQMPDSMLKRKSERHQFVSAALGPIVGLRWKSVNRRRVKFVGTVQRTSISGKERLTEYDVNFHLIPHLPQYLATAFEAFQVQKPMFKARKVVEEGQPPWIQPTDSTPYAPYKVLCECTPQRGSRTRLHDAFYPTNKSTSLEAHQAFGKAHPAVGLYGPLVLDCNHRCHPEIHPYEWIWWLGPNSGRGQSWFFGLIRDVSKRFKHWSAAPRLGTIKLPFVLPAEYDSLTISLDHLVYDEFDAEALAGFDKPGGSGTGGSDAYGNESAAEPEGPMHDLRQTKRVFTVVRPDGKLQRIVVKLNHPIRSDGIRYGLDKLTTDPGTGLLSGQFIMELAVQDLYTARLRTNY